MKQNASREWFAIRTKPQQEQVAKLHYQRQGYVAYLPIGSLNRQVKATLSLERVQRR